MAQSLSQTEFTHFLQVFNDIICFMISRCKDQISHYTSNCVRCQNCMHLFSGFTVYSSDKVACRVRPILALKFYITYSKYLTMNVMKIVFECRRNMLSYVNKSEKFSSFYRR